MIEITLPDGLPHPERVLTRKQATAYLAQIGYPISVDYLNKLAVTGGGPKYRRWGRSTIYSPSDLLEWASSRAGIARRHTSEAAA